MKRIDTYKAHRGQTLVLLLIFMIVAITITTASVGMMLVNIRGTEKLSQGTTAYDVAESGAETAMIKLLRDPNYTGETVPVGTGQAIITVSGSNPKTIVSKGELGNFSRKIQVIADYSNNVLTATSWKEID